MECLTDQSIGQLLVAGIIPGIVLMLFYMLTVYIVVLIKPEFAPSNIDKMTWKERFLSLKSTIWIIYVIYGCCWWNVYWIL